MTLTKISWKRWLAAFAIIAIGIPLMAMLGPEKADGAVPTVAPVTTVDRSDDRAADRKLRRQIHRAVLRRGVAPWNLPRHLKGADCGYLNPYTGNMGACLLQRSRPALTRADKAVISCAGQGAIAAAATLVVTPVAAPAVVAAVSTMASCAWGILNQ